MPGPWPTSSANISQQLSKAYLQTGDSARALTELLEYKAIEDSIQNFDFKKMLLQREFEGQQQQIAQLHDDNSLKDELLDRSKLLLLLAAGFIVASVLLIFALMQSIYRKKKYARHLKKKNETIREKTDSVNSHQAELEAKNKKLEEMDKTKNKIFSVLTHDLRQPITQIRSVLNLLESEQLSDEDRITMVSKLKESVDNSSNALENLLLWSKKQLTGITTKIVDIHLLPQVWQLESQVSPNLQSKNIQFKIKVPDFFKIQGDMNQLDICMRNLVNNAIKFTNEGGEICLDAFEEGDYKVIRIKDNGVGMDADQLEKLQNLSETFTTMGTMSEKGTGLGILIVHEFMENQNGQLRIESEKRKGSSFSMRFPKKTLITAVKLNQEVESQPAGSIFAQPPHPPFIYTHIPAAHARSTAIMNEIVRSGQIKFNIVNKAHHGYFKCDMQVILFYQHQACIFKSL
ncbi:MAG: HAMP domain-containing sensor histidine kinase [Owenweeksia sp.]|nr:HAMP domain-containing sensor histidine kinase [Owenweeksia sp.]